MPYLIEDDVESRLNLPAGAYDLPVIIQDRTLLPLKPPLRLEPDENGHPVAYASLATTPRRGLTAQGVGLGREPDGGEHGDVGVAEFLDGGQVGEFDDAEAAEALDAVVLAEATGGDEEPLAVQ